MTKVVRQLRSGQITIPAEFRKKLGIEKDTLLQVTLERGELRVRPVPIKETAGGSPWLAELYKAFGPVREEADKLSSEEIDADIDEAVKAVRQKHA